MIYLSIDIETTGLNPETCQVIEIGAVLEDTENPKPIADLPAFHAYVAHPVYQGEPYALAMHGRIFSVLDAAGRYDQVHMRREQAPYRLTVGSFDPDGPAFVTTAPQAAGALRTFLQLSGAPSPINLAGKNVAAFDLPFLKGLPGWSDIRTSHRCLDPGMLFLDVDQDIRVPSLQTCMDRAGMTGEVAHTALADAVTVVELLRWKYGYAHDPLLLTRSHGE